ARDECRAQRQFGGRELEGFAGQFLGNPVDFVEHLAGLNFSDVVLNATLTITHPHFCGFLGNGFVREDADPDAAATLDVTRNGTTGCFDLTGRDATTFSRLQAEFAERNGSTTGGNT